MISIINPNTNTIINIVDDSGMELIFSSQKKPEIIVKWLNFVNPVEEISYTPSIFMNGVDNMNQFLFNTFPSNTNENFFFENYNNVPIQQYSSFYNNF